MNLTTKVRRALLKAVLDDKDIQRVIIDTMRRIRARREGLVYISPLDLAVDQEGNLYWVEETKTHRLHVISEREPAVWPKKPEIESEPEESEEKHSEAVEAGSLEDRETQPE